MNYNFFSLEVELREATLQTRVRTGGKPLAGSIGVTPGSIVAPVMRLILPEYLDIDHRMLYVPSYVLVQLYYWISTLTL